MVFPVTVTCLFVKCISNVSSNEKIVIVSEAQTSVCHRLSYHCWTSYEGWSNVGMSTATLDTLYLGWRLASWFRYICVAPFQDPSL